RSVWRRRSTARLFNQKRKEVVMQTSTKRTTSKKVVQKPKPEADAGPVIHGQPDESPEFNQTERESLHPEPNVKRRGRKPKYRKECARVAKAMCRQGATDYDLAQEFEVATTTIWRWCAKYPEFCSAIKVEKASFDDRVERSLAQRALGYTYHAEKPFRY